MPTLKVSVNREVLLSLSVKRTREGKWRVVGPKASVTEDNRNFAVMLCLYKHLATIPTFRAAMRNQLQGG